MEIMSKNFDSNALEMLSTIFSLIEKYEDDKNLEIDILGEVLYITLNDSKQYVINKHSPSQQIWLSSPISGPNYFSYQKGEWIDKNGRELTNFIETEIIAL